MNRLEKALEKLAMHYAGKSGKLVGTIAKINATVQTINDDRSNIDWAIARINESIEEAKAIENQEPGDY